MNSVIETPLRLDHEAWILNIKEDLSLTFDDEVEEETWEQ